MKFHRDLPSDRAQARAAIYDGDAFLLPADAASSALVAEARAEVVAALGTNDIRAIAPSGADDDPVFRALGRVRRTLYTEPRFHAHVRAVLASRGFDPTRVAFDPIRLRVVASGGHDHARAAAVYLPHRDVWYAHSTAMIVAWIPLDDVTEAETFAIYPDHFRSPVPNASASFDYDAWVRDDWSLKIGWQHRDAGLKAHYPSISAAIDPGRDVGFSAKRGELLLVSGAHYHQTRRHREGRTRYSLDMRVVFLDDEARGLGAPRVDDASRGSALVDYVHPDRPWIARR